MAVINLSRETDGAVDSGGHPELVADQDGAPSRNRVVVGNRVNGKDFVVVDKLALVGDWPVGKAVGAGVKHAVWLEEAAVVNLVAASSLTVNSVHAS